MVVDDSSPCLLIVGAGQEQERLYEAARARGYSVACSDGNPSAPFVAAADYFINASTHDSKATASAALRFHQQIRKISGVVTLANDCAHTVAVTARDLSLPGIDPNVAFLSRDKWRFKKLMEDSQLRSPKGFLASTYEECVSGCHDLNSEKVVIKPVTGRGSEGVSLVPTAVPELVRSAWIDAASIDPNNLVLVEEFVQGVQLSTESFVQNRKVFTPILCERNYARMEEFSPRIIEDGGTIPARLNAVQEAAVRATLEGVVRALGVVDGTVKGDLVVEGDQVCVLEVALRLSGGWFASDQIRLACGVDLVTASISQAMGERVAVSDLTPSLNRATAIRYWFPEPGRIVEITGRAEVLDSPGVERVDIAFGVGDTLPAVRSHRDRFGSVVCSGEDRDKAIENVARALKCLSVRTEHEDDV